MTYLPIIEKIKILFSTLLDFKFILIFAILILILTVLYAIKKLKPKTVIVYGRMPDKIFNLARMQGVELIQFESEFSLSHPKEVN